MPDKTPEQVVLELAKGHGHEYVPTELNPDYPWPLYQLNPNELFAFAAALLEAYHSNTRCVDNGWVTALKAAAQGEA